MDADRLQRINEELVKRRLKHSMGRRLGIHHTNLCRKFNGAQGINPQQQDVIEAFCAEHGIRV